VPEASGAFSVIVGQDRFVVEDVARPGEPCPDQWRSALVLSLSTGSCSRRGPKIDTAFGKFGRSGLIMGCDKILMIV
jgi:hypothetical protein